MADYANHTFRLRRCRARMCSEWHTSALFARTATPRV